MPLLEDKKEESEVTSSYENAFKVLRDKQKRNKKIINLILVIIFTALFIFILSLVSQI